MLIEQSIEGKSGIYSLYCPACDKYHTIFTESEGPDRELWKLTGSIDKPTLDSDVIIFLKGRIPWILLCRFSLKDGIISYDDTCPHKFAGQSINLSDYADKNR